MEVLKNLEEFYSYAETMDGINDSSDSYKLKEILDSTEDKPLAAKITWEMEGLQFTLSKGRATGYISQVDKDGRTVYEYPSAATLSNEAKEYYIHRINTTSNLSLQIRFMQILVSTGDNQLVGEYITKLIDAYYNYIASLLVNPKEANGDSYKIVNLLKNLLPLIRLAKYRLGDFAPLLRKLFFSDLYVSAEWKDKLAKLIVNNKRLFEEDDLTSVYSSLDSIALLPAYVDNSYFMEMLAEVAMQLAKIIHVDHRIWHVRKAICYENEMNKRKGEEFIQMHWCEKAIQEYLLAGNKSKAEELHLTYADLRKNFKLDSFEVELDRAKLQEIYDRYDRHAKDFVLKNDSEFIFQSLANGNDLFPNITWLKENVSTQGKSFLDMGNLLKIDVNKNASKKIITEEDQEWYKLYQSYQHYLEFAILPQLRRIFYYGFVRQKINYRNLIDFLFKNSWVGCTLVSTDSGGKEMKYNWLSVLAPALYSFHLEFETLLFSKKNQINLILCIDSLTMKFEGLVRDFARLVGSHTTVFSKNNMREMYIEELLELPKIKEYFDENDMLLFKFLFVSKNGWNLRNNIAHSFFRFNDYRVEYMVLMIMALLRLGKYQVNTKNQTL